MARLENELYTTYNELMKYLCIPLCILGVIYGGISLLSMKLIRNGLVGFNGLSVEPVVVM